MTLKMKVKVTLFTRVLWSTTINLMWSRFNCWRVIVRTMRSSQTGKPIDAAEKFSFLSGTHTYTVVTRRIKDNYVQSRETAVDLGAVGTNPEVQVIRQFFVVRVRLVCLNKSKIQYTELRIYTVSQENLWSLWFFGTTYQNKPVMYTFGREYREAIAY